jgi:hypothetical protein
MYYIWITLAGVGVNRLIQTMKTEFKNFGFEIFGATTSLFKRVMTCIVIDMKYIAKYTGTIWTE